MWADIGFHIVSPTFRNQYSSIILYYSGHKLWTSIIMFFQASAGHNVLCLQQQECPVPFEVGSCTQSPWYQNIPVPLFCSLAACWPTGWHSAASKTQWNSLVPMVGFMVCSAISVVHKLYRLDSKMSWEILLMHSWFLYCSIMIPLIVPSCVQA